VDGVCIRGLVAVPYLDRHFGPGGPAVWSAFLAKGVPSTYWADPMRSPADLDLQSEFALQRDSRLCLNPLLL